MASRPTSSRASCSSAASCEPRLALLEQLSTPLIEDLWLFRAANARAELAKAEESGDQEMIEKFSKRTVRADKSHTEDCIKLLELMGVPVVKAVSEAEATCAAMNKVL